MEKQESEGITWKKKGNGKPVRYTRVEIKLKEEMGRATSEKLDSNRLSSLHAIL